MTMNQLRALRSAIHEVESADRHNLTPRERTLVATMCDSLWDGMEGNYIHGQGFRKFFACVRRLMVINPMRWTKIENNSIWALTAQTV